MSIRWGILGCGDVTEVKSGPGFRNAEGSSLAAVMRRDRAKAEDYARRHGVPRAYDRAAALVDDPGVDAIYVATPPSMHLELARLVARAGKPCLVEKPMAMSHAECVQMVAEFHDRGVPLWVAYYRRALPRFLAVRERLAAGAIGEVTAVHVQVTDRLATGATLGNWRFEPTIAGAGLFFDLGSHCFDLLDFLCGPIAGVHGVALNTAGAYPSEDVVAAAFRFERGLAGTAIFDFNAAAKTDAMRFTGTRGTLATPIFSDGDVVVETNGTQEVLPFRNPAHVHQPLIQAIVDELRGRGRCESTGESGARASWALDRCLGRE
jgi:predicted dehydrogenase